MRLKYITLIMTIFVSLLWVQSIWAYDFEKDGLYYNILSETTVECCGGGQSPTDATYRKTDVVIPSAVQRGLKTYTVVKIADYAWGRGYIVWITNLVLPETIIEIGTGAFRDANNIETMNFPEGLRVIGDYALRGPRLTDYIFPTTLESIGTRAFNSRLKSVVFTSATAPLIKEETFVYQRGGAYDIFIPSDLKIYVPSLEAYSDVPYYTEYMTPICSFNNHTYNYSGKVPNIGFSYDLPNNRNLSIDLENLPINAGNYNLVLSGTIDETLPIEIPFNLNIDKVNLQISASDTTRQYGDDNPILKADIFGLVNGEDINDVLSEGYQLYTPATVHSDIGEYPILLKSDIATNYTIEFIQGNLIITKAPLSIQLNNHSREYGLDNPTFTINYVGLKNDEQTPKWDKSPIFSTDASKISNVGKYPIAVTCEPHNYEMVSNENGFLSITPAPLTLTANNCQREYYEPNPQFTFTLEGLRNNDDESCLSKKPIYDCSAVIDSDCGEYNITPSSAESMNYTLSYGSGVLTVKKASLTLSADNISKEYGDENPILRFNIIGLKGNDTQESALQQLPSLTTSASTNTSVGEYQITVGGGISKNYQLAYRQGIMTITKAPLSVFVENAERAYGSNNPNFTRNYLGFKLTDTETTAFSVLPKISCPATKNSDTGEYPITITGGTARNYEIVSYENGTLSITKAKATIAANNKNRLYFEENPQFDFYVTGLLNGDTKSCLTTLPRYNCNANNLSNVGEYEIIPSDAVSKNYTFEYAPGILTVNKRQLTASIGNYSRVYGEDNPSFDVEYFGFVNNEDASDLIQSPTISCQATSISDVGTYPISLTGGQAINYYISKYNSGTLTITKANQKIEWAQDLSNIELYSQVELDATSSAGLPVSYEMSPNNVATLYSSAGKWYLDCYGSGAVNIRAVQNGDKNHDAATTVSKTLVVFGGGDDPSIPQIFLHVEEPGSLPSLIAENRKYQIRNLRLTGKLNGTDINFIREMCGSDSYGNSTVGVLETLDISGCAIVSGGRSYFQSNRTSENVVGNYMFYNCKVLTTLLIPENTISVGDYALADCERLSVITIPNCVKSYGKQSFRNNISLLRLPMPNELERIGDLAFSGCNGITEITIPSTVTSIGSGIVKDCQNLAQINVELGNTNYASREGVLFSSDFDELIIFPVNHEGSEYIVPEGVKKVASYAFVNATELIIVKLPSSLLSIGQDAFVGCVNLTTLQVQALAPPTCQNDCFDNISKTRCELQVPVGCRSYYWIAPVWSEFNKISEIDFSGIEYVDSDKVKISVENGSIHISGCYNDVNVRIYQANGTLVFNQTATEGIVNFTPNTSGIYIIVVGRKPYKVILK